MTESSPASVAETDIAIIGMAAHLPGAPDIGAYWRNLVAGVESIRRLSDDELLAAGESPARMARPNYVRAASVLDGFKGFDADFFGFSPKEAAILDPQHRHFLEVAWEALENAGHVPERFGGAIGVWAGCGAGTYFWNNLCSNRDLVEQTGLFLLRHTGNDKDFLATRVSHILDLKGPSINVQTACSTSLVAVHYAAQALLSGECDMALAGGVTIELPHGRGYPYEEGEILSPDGHCHAFDHRAQGTVFGSGAGCVVLRRATDALRDGDHVWALIRGSSVNNDGAAKAGYLAPSVDGQAACIATAQAVAGVGAESVSYVECHGTGTWLGDPIEVAALTEAFRETTDATGFCRIGSVKTNIGHLDTAAGVASLIKVALSLHHRQLPASLGFEAPNPAIDFDTSPFRVNDQLTEWETGGPLRAGVNSLGVGGTNAHAVLEEAPARLVSDESDWPFQPVVLSARTKAALDAQAARLAAHLRAHPEQPLADVAFTLKEGRRAFDRRRVLVARDHDEAAALLEGADPRRVFDHEYLGENPETVFMFPGGGAQYAGMARGLYETEPVFADWMDRGLAALPAPAGKELRALWLPAPGGEAAADEALKRPSLQLPLIMIAEYALAKLYESWGVRPAALVGHSMGENTAAALAGVMGFEDCVRLVHLRGQLFDTVPAGGMLSVPLDADELRRHLGDGIDLASVNAPGLCVVSGSDQALAGLAARLADEGVETARIAIDIAAHSHMVEPILERFGAHLRGMSLSAPRLSVISNRTGRALTAEDATDPAYWVAHLRHTVDFRACMETLKAGTAPRVFVEMGPGRALSSLARANGVPAGQVIAALRHPEQAAEDDAWHMASIARLWACGVAADWAPVWGGARRNRVPLPGYAFQRRDYFIEEDTTRAAPAEEVPARIADIAGWGWKPHWSPAVSGAEIEDLETLAPECWLVLAGAAPLGGAVVTRLRSAGHHVITLRAGDRFARAGADDYVLAPEQGREGYDRLIRDLAGRGLAPSRILHLWLADEGARPRPGASLLHHHLERGFWSLLFLLQAVAAEGGAGPSRLVAVTSGAARVRGEALTAPEKALILGPVRVAGKELPGLALTSLDVEAGAEPVALAERIIEETMSGRSAVAALRGGRRFEAGIRPAPLPEAGWSLPCGAHVLITGGQGGIGRTLAADLVRRLDARVTLVSRSVPAAGDLPAGNVHHARADVTNLAEMEAARDGAIARFGPVHAVIHAAGTMDDGPLMTRGEGAAAAVLAPKLQGTLVLDRLFPDGSLALMVLFSSTSTVTGPAGQVDYVAANEFLNAFAQSRAGGATRVVAIDWGMWRDVGMAARALGGEVSASVPLGQPLLATAGSDRHGNRILSAHLDEGHWLLDGHRTKAGRQALLPGTGYLELAAEAWRACGNAGGFDLRGVTFLRALDLAPGEGRPLRLRLSDDGGVQALEVQSGVSVAGRQGWLTHATATLAPLAAHAPRLDTVAIAARLPAPVTGDGLATAQEAHLAFGPRWRVLESRAVGAGEGLARLHLPDAFAPESDEGWLLHPALLDIACGWAMELIAGYRPDHLWVPVSIDRFAFHRPLPARIVSHMRNAGANVAAGEVARFDITLATPSGEVCAEITGFTLRRLEGGLTFPAPDARALEPDGGEGDIPSPAEERLLATLQGGICPDEGAEALARALALGAPQVIVSSLDLPALIRRTTQDAEPPRREGEAFERPDLDSDYVEPSTPIEQRLAGFWRELLGVEKVGVEDSFFDLGGHSLIAVRLFAMVKKAFRVEFPISVLFEAPTIAACARLIAEATGDTDDSTDERDEGGEGKGAAPAPIHAQRRFTHVVPMTRTGSAAAGTPFFMVAGMLGNVLNLRHMALLLGNDRPFHGLQARGLYGEDAPHDNFPDAARDYIVELRQVQPHGPYLLGGYSGGGLIAWEMARQLEKAGERVAQLVLLDTPLPMRPRIRRRDKALIKLAELRRKGPAYLAEWARNRWAWEVQKRHPRVEEADETTFHDVAIEAGFRAALPLYRMARREGATVLFRPPLDRHWKVSGGMHVTSEWEYVFPDNDLTQFAPALEVVEVPGDHNSMVLEPNVRVLAARLREILARADVAAAEGAGADAGRTAAMAAE